MMYIARPLLLAMRFRVLIKINNHSNNNNNNNNNTLLKLVVRVTIDQVIIRLIYFSLFSWLNTLL